MPETPCLSSVFKDRRRPAFIPFLSAGAPSRAWSLRFLEALADSGADLIELGVPFSDPVADGPVIQLACEKALRSGGGLKQALALAKAFRGRGGRTPLLLFSYLNPVLAMGLDQFAQEAKEAGVQGALIVDLPPEEAADYRRAMSAAGLETVFLASPTTSRARLRKIAEASTGFVYYVSRLGVTGERRSLSASLGAEVARVRRGLGRPLAVGFGISTPAQARQVASLADGVVVGSALVSFQLEQSPARGLAGMTALARSLARAVGRRA